MQSTTPTRPEILPNQKFWLHLISRLGGKEHLMRPLVTSIEAPSNGKLQPPESDRDKEIRTRLNSGSYYTIKSMMDFSISFVALFILSPLLILIAVAIKLESKGPVFFRQNRTGQFGVTFQIFKFRSMYLHSDEKVMQAQKQDARITKVGAFLRRTSLDELPQLLNVLWGDMSLVGPRPHAQAHDIYYGKALPFYNKRFSTRPGITGLAQVNDLRGETKTIEEMAKRVKCDIEYIKNPSILNDIVIILKTPLCLITTKHAY